ncbi:MAG: hypothetical protein ACM3OC_02455 [Deltaproteobacteria bacterium]
MKRRFLSLVIPVFAISMIGAVSTVDNFITCGSPWSTDRHCPSLIRKIYLEGVGSQLRADVSDAVQPYKLMEMNEKNVRLMIDSIRRVYQANCMLERLSEIRFRMRRDELFIVVKEIRYAPGY